MDAEYPFRVPLISPSTRERLGIALEGFIDLIEEGEVLTEFKTSGKTMDTKNVDDLLQLTIYGYAYKTLFGKEPRLLRVVNFVKTRTPKMVVLETEREKKDYKRLFYLVKRCSKGSNLVSSSPGNPSCARTVNTKIFAGIGKETEGRVKR